MTAGLLISSGSHFSPSGGKPGRGWGPLPPGGAGAGRGLPKAEGGTESPPPGLPKPHSNPRRWLWGLQQGAGPSPALQLDGGLQPGWGPAAGPAALRSQVKAESP